MDSVALLHLFTRAQLDFQIQINAIHIHHGLNTHADDWQKFCEQLCAQWQIPIQIVHVQVKNQGLGIEASVSACGCLWGCPGSLAQQGAL